jgi:hypothetical protein
MKRWIDMGAQALLGLIFLVSGLNGFLHFMPTPSYRPPATEFLQALADTGYFVPVLKVVETAGGALLLARRFSALALVLLAPVVVQILLFHVFLAPSGLPLALLLVLLEAYVGFVARGERFRALLKA